MTATARKSEATTGVAHVVTLHTIGSRRFRHVTIWDAASEGEACDFAMDNLAHTQERVSLVYSPGRAIRKSY